MVVLKVVSCEAPSSILTHEGALALVSRVDNAPHCRGDIAAPRRRVRIFDARARRSYFSELSCFDTFELLGNRVVNQSDQVDSRS